jgi:hypothetical protein
VISKFRSPLLDSSSFKYYFVLWTLLPILFRPHFRVKSTIDLVWSSKNHKIHHKAEPDIQEVVLRDGRLAGCGANFVWATGNVSNDDEHTLTSVKDAKIQIN